MRNGRTGDGSRVGRTDCRTKEPTLPNPISEPVTRPSMLLRLRDDHDESAWQTFVDVYGRLVYRYCRRRGLQDADAVDVMQDVLVQVSRSMPGFAYNPHRGKFRGWLATVTRNKLNRFWKRTVATSQLAEADAPATHDVQWDDEYHQMLLAAAVQHIRPCFEPLTWQAFESVWFDQLDAAETARRLNLPIERVYVAKSRVLKRLQQTVTELADQWVALSPGTDSPISDSSGTDSTGTDSSGSLSPESFPAACCESNH